MEHATDGGKPEPGAGPLDSDGGLLDLSSLSLRDIFTSDDSALGHAMRQLLDDLERPCGVISAFQSLAT